MLNLLKSGEIFEYIETLKKHSDGRLDVEGFKSYNNNIFAYFEWYLNNDLKLNQRKSNYKCISEESNKFEENKIKYWQHKIANIIYNKLDDTTFYKYIPYYIKSRDDYKEKMINGEIIGGILECIGFVMLSDKHSIRIIDMNMPNDIYIYQTLEHKTVIQFINRKEMQESIDYYNNLLDEMSSTLKSSTETHITENNTEYPIDSDDETEDEEIEDGEQNRVNETNESHINLSNFVIQNSFEPYINNIILPNNTIYENILNIQPENVFNLINN